MLYAGLQFLEIVHGTFTISGACATIIFLIATVSVEDYAPVDEGGEEQDTSMTFSLIPRLQA